MADPASFVVVQGLWLPPETAEADAAPQADALPVEGFHGINAGHGLGWLRSATQNRLYAEGLGGRYQLYVFQGPKPQKACYHVKQQRWLGANWCRVPALLDAMARFDEVLLFLYLDTDAFLNNFRVPLDRFLESDPLKPLAADKVLFPWNNTHWGWKKAKALGHARWATTGALALVSCAPARLLLKRWWAGANHRSDQREFIRVLGREERVSVIAEESSPRGAYDNRTYVLHRCGGCRWMPPLERLLNASRAANGVDDASAADALAAVWETRVLATFKQ